jgi:hypothetical protein
VRFLCEQLDGLQQLTKPLRPRAHPHMLHLALPGTPACARCRRTISAVDNGWRDGVQSLIWPLHHSPNILDEYATNQEGVFKSPPDGYVRCLASCTCDELHLRRLGHATGCPFKVPGSPFKPA